MRTLVVTGGIGSGKSSVCALLEGRGIPVYDSDSRTKSLYDNDRELVERIGSAMGCRITDDEGRLDRRLLASLIFSDGKLLGKLEGVVHPAVLDDFNRWKSRQEKEVRWSGAAGEVPFVVMESAIILEKPLFRNVADKVLLVDAPYQVRLARASARDGAAPEEVERRMARQPLLNAFSLGLERPDADFVLTNGGEYGALEAKVDSLLRILWKNENKCIYI